MLSDKFMLQQRMNYLRWELQNSLQQDECYDKNNIFTTLMEITEHIHGMFNFWMTPKLATESDGIVTVVGLPYYLTRNDTYLKVTVNERGEVNVEIDKDFKGYK